MVYSTAYNDDYPKGVERLFQALAIEQTLSMQKQILIKPNLVEDIAPPVTTPVACVKAIVDYLRELGSAEIIIAEGCGSLSYETERPFQSLGYKELADSYGLRLVDLNSAETTVLTNKKCSVFHEFHFPAIGLQSYVISVPVLKAHSLADVTLGMKNMMGFAPPSHYSSGGWKKSAFHSQMHESIVDLMRYRTPDLTIIDASVGLSDYHLGGPHCNPPVNQLIAGEDVVEVDAYGASLLGLKWQQIAHIQKAHQVLGCAEYRLKKV